MTEKLPKHIAQMVEKNNLVMAITTLADEQNISMDEAKERIDAYEAQLKNQHAKKAHAIANKQGISSPPSPTNNGRQTPHDAENALQSGLDQHLASIGYKKPLIPFWAKRIAIILTMIALLSLIFWQFLS